MQSLTDKIKFIESIFGKGILSRNSKNFDIICPNENCVSNIKGKRKLSIRLEDDANHCWICEWKAKNLAPLIKRYGTRQQLSEYINVYNNTVHKSILDQQITENKQLLKLPNDFTLLTEANLRNPDIKACLNYIESRNVSYNDMWFYKIGISNEHRWHRRVIIPSFDVNGDLNYYVGRAIDKKRLPKYDNVSIESTTIIFNECNIEWNKELVLCEGPFDYIKCPENTIPLLGSSLNEESELFCKIISNSTPIVLALDPDVRNTKTKVLIKKLQEYDVDVRVIELDSDPGSKTKEQMNELIKNCKVISWEYNLKQKLQNFIN